MRGKNKILNRNTFFLTLILLVFIVTGFFVYRQLKSDDFMLKLEKNEYIAVSFNVQRDQKLMFSELIIFSPKTHKAAIFNIPGNYGSIIESLSRIERLDILFDFKKPDRMIKKIENITDIKIDYFVNIDSENLVKAVDMLSGLEMFIANPVEIINDKEIVMLPSGSSNLDGEKILTFLYAETLDENDPDLIGRWHKFVQGFLKKTGEKSDYLSDKEIFGKYFSWFTTDMNKESFKTFIHQIKMLDSERMILQRILGDRKKIDDQVLLFPYYNGNLLRETIKQTLSSVSSEDIISDEELNVVVEILNGTNIPGMAGRTAHFFTNLGYDVISTKNADRNDYEKTLVIANGVNPAAAQKAANIIRCNNIESGNERIEITTDNENNYNPGNKIDVTIILGKDFDGRYCK